MSDEATTKPLVGDNPIRELEQDVLGRVVIAARFAQQVLDLNLSEGAAVGVFGPWGSGKTSFVNLARKTFEAKNVPVIDFNPWMFSGVEQLVARFFAELSSEMERNSDLKKISKIVRKYSGAFVKPAAVLAGSIFGSDAEKVTKALADVLLIPSESSGSIRQLRDEAENTLREHDKPIIVFLDDVDRLSSQEIREVFKLVRLTASFPNLVYIVACDRLRVETALEEPGLPGRNYIEKIIQFPYNLPETPRRAIREQARAAIASLDPDGDDRQFNVFLRIVEPLLQTMRDVRRYEIAIRSTAVNLEGKVQISDVLGLEAIRLFLPDVFERLHGAVDILTVTSSYRSVEWEVNRDGIRPLSQRVDPENPDDQASSLSTWIDESMQAAGPKRQLVRDMIDNLFPGAGSEPKGESVFTDEQTKELLQRGSVGHEENLRFYLERVSGKDLQALENAREAVELMADRGRLEEFMSSRNPEEQVAMIQHLATLHKEFTSDHVEPGLIAILNLLPDCPALYFHDLQLSTRRVTFSLLSKLPAKEAFEAAVRRIRLELTSAESKYELAVPLVCKGLPYSLNVDVKELTEEFKMEVRDWIRSDFQSDRIEDEFIAAFLLFPIRIGLKPVQIPNDPETTFRIFWSCSKLKPASVPRYYWEMLLEVYGDEATLRERMNDLRKGKDGLVPFLTSRGISTQVVSQLLDRAEEGRKQKAG